jgi:predicted ribosome quality control (RQC) complex YloA/Tae2 family protein
MNSYYTLIYSNESLKATLINYRFVKALTNQKHILEIVFEKNGVDKKLIVSLNPVSPLFFMDEKASIKSHNAASFFGVLDGRQLIASEVTDGDRLVILQFDDDYRLMLQLFGPKPNVFLTQNNLILEAFKASDDWEGKPEPKPRRPIVIPFNQTSGVLKQRIFKAYPFIQRSFVPDLIFHGNLEQKGDNEIELFLNKVEVALKSIPEFRRMSDGRFCLIPSAFIPDENSEKFNDINAAIRVIFFSDRSGENFNQLREQVLKKLGKEISRCENLIRASEESLKSLERASTYNKYADILMANAHIKRLDRNEALFFDDIYNPGSTVEIKLKPDTTFAQNAAIFYEKKKKSERSFEILNEEAERATEKLTNVKALERNILELKNYHSLKQFLKQHKDNVFLIGADQPLDYQSRPYLIAHTGKFEIWIGKNAKGNDELLRDSHKEDIWMHARGVSGSHVIIRMQKKTHDPELAMLELAASWAAWKSKARGAEFVPVIWTRRKFVRKPKGAAPGTVIVQQEKVLIIQPKEPKNEYFRN